MTVRPSLTVETVLLAVLAGGLASFVVVHSLGLLNTTGEQTASILQRLWFLGLVLVAIAVAVTWRRS
jgi:small neutral amino acid transporter SnatA (MarC family)